MWEHDAINHPTKDVPFQSGSFPVQMVTRPRWRW